MAITTTPIEARVQEVLKLADNCLPLYRKYRRVVERLGNGVDSATTTRQAFLDARAILETALRSLAASATQVPQGWKLVPVEPDDTMKQAGIDVAPSGLLEIRGQLRNRASWSTEECAEVYRAMIEKSPPAPQAATQGEAVAEPACCPNCSGTGTQTFMTSHLGPDDYEFEGNCEHCLGEGTLSAGYVGALRLLEDAEKRYSRASADLWAISHIGDVEGWKVRPNAHQDWQLILPKSQELSKAVDMRWEIVPLFARVTHTSGLPPRKALAVINEPAPAPSKEQTP